MDLLIQCLLDCTLFFTLGNELSSETDTVLQLGLVLELNKQ